MKLAGWKPLNKSAETIETQHDVSTHNLREWLPEQKLPLKLHRHYQPWIDSENGFQRCLMSRKSTNHPPAPQATPHPNKPTARNNAINWDQTTHADTLLQTPTASNDFVLSTTSKYTTYIANILHTHSSVQTTAYTSYIYTAYIYTAYTYKLRGTKRPKHTAHYTKLERSWNDRIIPLELVLQTSRRHTTCNSSRPGSSPNKFESSR
jgi:hypothetical protein